MVQSVHDDAVSSTIATILMVAVVVTLAAIVASFGFGSTGDLQENGIVGATATQYEDGTISVTYVGGMGDREIDHLNWTIDGVEQTNWLDHEVGASATNATPIADPWGTHQVMVMATYLDGSSQVILNTQI
ncbi:ABC-type transport system involved in cytochrome c biogenesis permease subunit [Methanofollis sp. W23]|uniref:type IV pilin n=1 Tax=Methanofollis sp. W23 TaxID=2817849 RepID=UPI001AEBA0D8|nr:type IV pilin N-terminal domain-containing protein [Methanofollis sp. W23]MBP2145902.1 ABC-type transport system involved in cytochrome c biogenesis permease subunit [Methanofollis sp. W23]